MAGGIAYQQTTRFSQPIAISGRRILSAAASAALPAIAKIVAGALPTGYTDHGAIVQGLVEISVEVNVDSIDLGRVPSPSRFYVTGQKGMIKAGLQEYQPEMIDLAAGNSGTPTVVGSGSTGYTQVYIGGKLGSQRRLLVFDDFDVDFTNDAFLYDQYWWTSPTAQAHGSFTLGTEKAQTIVPIEYQLLRFDISGVNRMLEFRAINHS